MRQKVLLTVLALLVIGAGAAFGQTTASHDIQVNIGTVHVIAVENADVVVLTTTDPAAPGLSVGGTTGTKALYYTVLTAVTYRITAHITAGVLPDGTLVSVTADPGPATNGDTSGAVVLTGTAQTIITNIESTATGRTPGGPPELLYTLVIDDENALTAGDSGTIQVTLTLAPL